MPKPLSDGEISLTAVTKIFRLGLFGHKTAVEDLTFSVPAGQVVGLLGANGSGKSTTLKMILGFLKPTSGEIQVCGTLANERSTRAAIGYLPENPRFQKFLSATQILRYYGKLHNLSTAQLNSRVPYLLELVGLKNAARERVQGFSKGMTQRLAIAQSLLNQPKLLIFDEPMSGLDPLGRREIRELISQIHGEFPQSTLFFSTHILSDVEQLCSSVILLRKGQLKNQCGLRELLEVDTQRFTLSVSEIPDALRHQYQSRFVIGKNAMGMLINLSGVDNLVEVVGELRKNGIDVMGIESQRKNLEEALFSDLETEIPSPSPVAEGA